MVLTCYAMLFNTWASGFSDFPLEKYLEDVPDDKVFVLTNFRSAFTNAFFVRNNAAGRELMRDWLAIIESGYVQCHGWDQVPSRNTFSGF
jgi:hypothetical protein